MDWPCGGTHLLGDSNGMGSRCKHLTRCTVYTVTRGLFDTCFLSEKNLIHLTLLCEAPSLNCTINLIYPMHSMRNRHGQTTLMFFCIVLAFLFSREAFRNCVKGPFCSCSLHVALYSICVYPSLHVAFYNIYVQRSPSITDAWGLKKNLLCKGFHHSEVVLRA